MQTHLALLSSAMIAIGCGSSHSTPAFSGQTEAAESAAPVAADEESAPTASPPPIAWDEAPLLSNEIEFVITDQRLSVLARGRSALITQVSRIESLDEVRWAASGQNVAIRYTDPYACDSEHELSLSRAELEAAWTHESALEAHRRGEYALAVAALRRAIELDAGSDLTPIHLARSLNQLGRSRDAIEALLALLERKAIYVYSQLSADSETRSLLSEPELQALRAETRVELDPQALSTDFLIGPDGSIMIPIREESDATDQVRVEVVIQSPSNETRYRSVLIDWIDTDESGALRPARRPLVESHLRELATWLGDLGFHPVPGVIHVAMRLPATRAIPTTALRARLDESGFTLTESARVIRYLSELREANGATLSYLPAPRALVLRWSRDRAEGCDDGVHDEARYLPLESSEP